MRGGGRAESSGDRKKRSTEDTEETKNITEAAHIPSVLL
jgi:hypothetical protein